MEEMPIDTGYEAPSSQEVLDIVDQGTLAGLTTTERLWKTDPSNQLWLRHLKKFDPTVSYINRTI